MKMVFRVFDRAVQICIFLCIAGFVAVSFSQVFCRFVLNNSIPWAEELCRYLFVWMVFIGAGLGILHRRHIMIDIVPNLIPRAFKKYYTAALDLIVFVFTLLLIYTGYVFAVRGMRQFSPAMQIPMGYIFSGIVVGGAIMCINSVRALCVDLFAAPVEAEPEPALEPEMTQEEFNKLLGIGAGGVKTENDNA